MSSGDKEEDSSAFMLQLYPNTGAVARYRLQVSGHRQLAGSLRIALLRASELGQKKTFHGHSRSSDNAADKFAGTS